MAVHPSGMFLISTGKKDNLTKIWDLR